MANELCYACNEAPRLRGNDLCAECLNDPGLQLLLAEPGLSTYEYTMTYNMIKGRIAETLIEELFLRIGYSVYRCGMENTLPGVMKHLVRDNSDIARHIRKMPDFAVRNPYSEELIFIEVKFRAEGIFSAKDLGKDYPYDDAYVVVVSRRHIKCLTARELKDGGVITPSTQNYLGYRHEFARHKEVIIDFCRFATQFFANV